MDLFDYFTQSEERRLDATEEEEGNFDLPAETQLLEELSTVATIYDDLDFDLDSDLDSDPDLDV